MVSRPSAAQRYLMVRAWRTAYVAWRVVSQRTRCISTTTLRCKTMNARIVDSSVIRCGWVSSAEPVMPVRLAVSSRPDVVAGATRSHFSAGMVAKNRAEAPYTHAFIQIPIQTMEGS